MKILVTGGCGFIGSNLVRYLIENTKHSVTNCDSLTYASNDQSLEDLANNDRYQHCCVDITDKAGVKAMIEQVRPEAVMHLAAESHVDRSIDDADQFIQTNIIGTYNLLYESRNHFAKLNGNAREQFRFLHISTDEVYGSLDDTGYFSEATRYDPRSPYSASKASSDHLAKAWYHTYGLPVIVTHCSNNYGPYQFPEKLIPLIIMKCLSEESIPLYGDGTNVRDWLYVEDHVTALLAVLAGGIVGETYDIGSNNERRNIDLVKQVCQILDRRRPRQSHESYSNLITYVQDRAGHDFRYAIDSSKIREQLGWEPTHSFAESLAKTVDWYLDNTDWWQSI